MSSRKSIDADRYIDLRLDVMEVDENCKETERELLSVGGKWDRRKKAYVDDAESAMVMQAHPGQVPFVEWYSSWLTDHMDGVEVPDEERIYSALLAGGQRSGKTHVGVCVSAISYALAMPKSIVWVVCPTDKDFEEIEDYLEETMPKHWYKHLGSPWFRYTLANGSRIVLRSGHVPQALKKGRADLIVGNEMQRMSEKAFAIMRGRIADKGGMVIGLANPPDSPMGAWVGDWAVEAESGLRQSKYFYFDPFLNPFISQASMIALRGEIDAHTFDVEVLGKFLTPKGTVLYNWDRFENERTHPEDEFDITRSVCRYFEGREYDRVVGVDVQKHPYMASVEFRMFANPLATKGSERFMYCHMWATAAVLLDGADEFSLADEWLAMGWDPERTLVVCDASGAWQFAERNVQKVGELRKKLGGRGSFDAFKSKGFRHIVKPVRGADKNPDILERVRTSTARIGTAAPGPYGRQFLFSDPRNKRLNRCLRKWPTKHGVPSRSSEHAHAGDAFTYPVIRFFPRGQSDKEDLPSVKLIPRKRDGRMSGW